MNQAPSIPDLQQPDFLDAARALFPPGDAWAALGISESVLDELVNACVGWLARVHARAADLTEREANPATAIELLPEWEESYGLPDPCSPPSATIAQRHAALIARIASAGGQSEAYFIGVAKSLGYDITITRFDAAQYGVSTYGSPMYSEDWRFAWQVNTANITVFPAKFGEAVYGEPYTVYSDTQLECVLSRIKPTVSVLIMNYEG